MLHISCQQSIDDYCGALIVGKNTCFYFGKYCVDTGCFTLKTHFFLILMTSKTELSFVLVFQLFFILVTLQPLEWYLHLKEKDVSFACLTQVSSSICFIGFSCLNLCLTNFKRWVHFYNFWDNKKIVIYLKFFYVRG